MFWNIAEVYLWWPIWSKLTFLIPGMHWSAVMTTSHSSSHWFQAWSSSALIWSWSVCFYNIINTTVCVLSQLVTSPWHSCLVLVVQDVPYLDVAPYMPEYYKPQNLLDFEERLPSSDSLSLHSFTSLTSTNLEWDDSAIAPSSEGEMHWFSLTPLLSDPLLYFITVIGLSST